MVVDGFTCILLVPGIIAMIYSSVTYANHAPMKVGIDYTAEQFTIRA